MSRTIESFSRSSKVCEVCHKEYQGTFDQKYCGTTCRKAEVKRRYAPKGAYRVQGKVPKKCDVCAEEYQGVSNQRFCGGKCRAEFNTARALAAKARRNESKRPEDLVKKCRVCGQEFEVRVRRVYCSRGCQEIGYIQYMPSYQKKPEPETTLDTEELESVVAHQERPRGRYVYGWCHPQLDLPFYVGSGAGNRAWVVHKKILPGSVGRAFCEQYRTKDTRVVIYRDNLTLEGALLVESVLISLFKSMGAAETNNKDPLKRQEEPPLEM